MTGQRGKSVVERQQQARAMAARCAQELYQRFGAPDNNAVRANVVLGNGRHPDPERVTIPGADIVYLASGVGNCFERNVFQTQFPEDITGGLPCP